MNGGGERPRGGRPPWEHQTGRGHQPPPWVHGRRGYGGHGGWRHRRRRRASLRRRLTIAFAVVALGAVALTTWTTIGAVAAVQRDLAPSAQPGGPVDGQAPTGARDGSLEPVALEAFGQIRRTAFRAGALSFVMAVLAAGAFTNFLTRPLHALTRGARRLEAGERGIRLSVPAGRDELGSLTEAFNALVEGLERQEAWRRNMTADIAHDLRTPLAVLRSEIEGMQDGVVPADEAGLQRLHREVMLLARLIDDLRTLSVGDVGALSLELADVEIEPLLRRSVEAFRSRAAEVGAELRLAPVEPGLRAELDADRISQVVGNLLDNALRHAGGVTIELGAEAIAMPPEDVTEDPRDDPPRSPGSDALRVWVRDRGPGVPREALDQVFERFYRADSARTRADGDGSETGSGLGLAIARTIIEAHGGRIDARNHHDGGAVFEFYLPVLG